MAKLQTDLARALDPASLFRDLGLEPDPWQAEFLSGEIERGLLCCCRQSGKSTAAAALALHEALYRAPALVLLLSPSLRQSAELFRKCAEFYRTLAEAEPLAAESVLRMELMNASRIVSLPGSDSTVRGYSKASLVVIDEASRCADDLIAAVRPSLAVSNGRLLMLSTPWGKRGAFYREWTFGGEHWRRFMLKAKDCPRISKEFLAEEEKALGPFLFQQEYCCEFLDAETSVFSSALIEAALSEEVKPLWR